MESLQLKDALMEFVKKDGKRSFSETKKMYHFSLLNGESVYVKRSYSSDSVERSVNAAPMVINPSWMETSSALKAIEGIDVGGIFFSSNMTRFPKKVNKGDPQFYGLEIYVDSQACLLRLIRYLEDSTESNDSGQRRESVGQQIEVGLTSERAEDEFTYSLIKQRRGQSKFRTSLFESYGGKCCISGSDVGSVLEAAHIVPHAEEKNYSVLNGLLLRADIHTLYDLNLIGIDEYGKVSVHESLKSSEYGTYQGQYIADEIPSAMQENLKYRFASFCN